MSNNVQSYIANISVSKTLKEIITLFLNTKSITALDYLFEENAYVEWTAPKWIKKDDIVFFMFSVTSKIIIQRLRKEFSNNEELFLPKGKMLITQSLNKSEELYNSYGGSIFAIGRVKGKLLNNSYATENEMHWKSQIYAPISDIVILKNPILYSEFKNIIEVSKQSSITGVFGEDFDQLKRLIMSKNDVPDYVKQSIVSICPLSKIDKSNWLHYANEYRRSFFLEIQFRSYYSNFLLQELSDISTIYKECPCKKNSHTAYVDNVIVFLGYYLPVEIKLSIDTEKNLQTQCEQYCNLDKMILDKNKECNMSKLISDKVLIIDTEGIYLYSSNLKNINKIFSLDNLKEISQIGTIKTLIKEKLNLSIPEKS
ncbi:MAG: hypothetical protein UHW86_10045 [Spirochaetota bacterium]|nr:hypothetical protein [Spirochaetota bacterium]